MNSEKSPLYPIRDIPLKLNQEALIYHPDASEPPTNPFTLLLDDPLRHLNSTGMAQLEAICALYNHHQRKKVTPKQPLLFTEEQELLVHPSYLLNTEPEGIAAMCEHIRRHLPIFTIYQKARSIRAITYQTFWKLQLLNQFTRIPEDELIFLPSPWQVRILLNYPIKEIPEYLEQKVLKELLKAGRFDPNKICVHTLDAPTIHSVLKVRPEFLYTLRRDQVESMSSKAFPLQHDWNKFVSRNAANAVAKKLAKSKVKNHPHKWLVPSDINGKRLGKEAMLSFLAKHKEDLAVIQEVFEVITPYGVTLNSNLLREAIQEYYDPITEVPSHIELARKLYKPRDYPYMVSKWVNDWVGGLTQWNETHLRYVRHDTVGFPFQSVLSGTTLPLEELLHLLPHLKVTDEALLEVPGLVDNVGGFYQRNTTLGVLLTALLPYDRTEAITRLIAKERAYEDKIKSLIKRTDNKFLWWLVFHNKDATRRGGSLHKLMANSSPVLLAGIKCRKWLDLPKVRIPFTESWLEDVLTGMQEVSDSLPVLESVMQEIATTLVKKEEEYRGIILETKRKPEDMLEHGWVRDRLLLELRRISEV